MSLLIMPYLLMALSGLLVAISYPNPWFEGHLVFAFLGWPLFYRQLHRARKAIAPILLFLLFSFVFNLINFSWITHALEVFGPMPKIAAWGLMIIHCLFVLLHLWPVVIYFCLRLRFAAKITIPHGIHLLIIFWLHLWGEQWMPQLFGVWLGHSALTTSLPLTMASWIGAGGYSALLLTLFLLLLPQQKFQKKSWMAALALAGIILMAEFMIPKGQLEYHSVPMRLVQGNVGNFQKIQAELGAVDSLEEVYQRYRQHSLQATLAGNFAPELILWPETAVPDAFDSSIDELNDQPIREPLRQLIMELPAPLLMGGYDQGHLYRSINQLYSEYNSTLLWNGPTLKGFYHKHLLLPFGETLPFGPLNPWLYPYAYGVSFFSQGALLQTPLSLPLKSFPMTLQILTPICYEILKPHLIAAQLRHWEDQKTPIHLLVNPSNDSWYGISAEPRQHLFLSRWRSLEFGLPLVRMTNTGISAVIDDRGRVVDRIELGVTGSKDILVPITKIAPLTPYARWPQLSLFCLMLVLSCYLYFFILSRLS